jgi:sugar phosphate permease
MQGAYYAVTTWLPTYLKMERNLSVLNTSGYLIVLIAGSFAGYLTSAWLSDRLGRATASCCSRCAPACWSSATPNCRSPTPP